MTGNSARTFLNAWGQPVVDDGDDPNENPYWVPEDQRLDLDAQDSASNALGEDGNGEDTGDDLDGWKPGDDPS